MAIAVGEVTELGELELMAHLFRRAGFGATRDELEAALAKGYEATVDDLVHPERQPTSIIDLIYRFYPDMQEARGSRSPRRTGSTGWSIRSGRWKRRWPSSGTCSSRPAFSKSNNAQHDPDPARNVARALPGQLPTTCCWSCRRTRR